jgi:hypothetical protein
LFRSGEPSLPAASGAIQRFLLGRARREATRGDDPVQGIAACAHDERLTATHFAGIGASSDLRVGYFDRERKDYARIVIDEQVEVLSLMGPRATGESRRLRRINGLPGSTAEAEGIGIGRQGSRSTLY